MRQSLKRLTKPTRYLAIQTNASVMTNSVMLALVEPQKHQVPGPMVLGLVVSVAVSELTLTLAIWVLEIYLRVFSVAEELQGVVGALPGSHVETIFRHELI